MVAMKLGRTAMQHTAKNEAMGGAEASGRTLDEVRPSILLVDDDSRNLFAMEEVLRGLGHEIVQARSGEEALRHLLERDIALILMDVQMPGLDGYRTAELIRTRDRCRHVPIIFVTAVSKDDHQIFRGYSAGAVDYIFKPINALILRSKVAVFVELFRKTEEVKRQAELERRLLEDNLRIRAEKLRSERALRRRDEQYAMIIRSLPVVLYSLPPAESGGKHRFISENIEAITGFPVEAFIEGEAFWQSRLHPEDRERVLGEFATLAERGALSTEYRWICADGGERHFLDQAVFVRDQRGRDEIFGTWFDITDRKQLEVQLQNAQRLEAVGRLTGGIAHDFNNMLCVVIGNLDMLNQKAREQPDLERIADLALKGALRCSDLTRRLLTFARRQPLQSKAVDLGEFVPGMIDLLRRAVGENIRIEYRAAEALPLILADPAQLEATLLNLVFNARDAMSDGGCLTIDLEPVEFGEGSGRPAECPPGRYLALSVSDTGTGMPPEVLARAFEPFFTTKEIGHGTGLGLSTTYGFLKQLGGHVEIDSRVDDGTRVALYFPLPAEGVTVPGEAPATADRVARIEVDGAILVVEDEDDVRDMVVATLGGLGVSTLQAANGRAALELIDRHEEIRVLFTDLMMPGMNGTALAEEALRRRPDLKVIYTSGYAEAIDAATAPASLLRKPYRAQEMIAYIAGFLDGED